MRRVVLSGLAERVVDAGRRVSSQVYEFIALLVEFDRSGEWAFDGARNCARWVAERLDVEVSTAREWLRIGRALDELPVIHQLFANGELSYSKVRALVRVAEIDTEAELCAIAARTTAGRLPGELAAWLVRHERPARTRARQHAATGLRWRVEPDAMVRFSGCLPPAAAGAICAAIDQHVMRSRRGRHGSTPVLFAPPTDRWLSLAQQRAYALADLLTNGSSGLVAELVVHIRGDGCFLDDGTPIDDHAVARLLPGAFVRALIYDAERRPVSVSTRRRFPTPRQKRLVKARDRVCVDCGSAELLQYDHEPDYTVTRRTHTDEVRLRCTPCHSKRHQTVDS